MRYSVGDPVKVRLSFPPGHVRALVFCRGKQGVVTQLMGAYPNPEELAYGRDGKPELPLYRVLFKQTELWDDYNGPAQDTTVIDIYENWLEPAEER